MISEADIFNRVAAHLIRVAGPHKAALQLTFETEVYYDLGLYGDDIYELFVWMEREFGVQGHVDIGDYGPGESGFFGIWESLRKKFGRGAQYKSLKIRDIIAAIQAKRWPG